jgi:ATP-dependent exoDNAse (exonuclease V) beta subunit
MYQNKYLYDGREEIDGKRFYKINEYTRTGLNWLYFPSVTTVTSLLPNPKLEQWKLSVGEEASKSIAKAAADRGTCMHEFLEVFMREYNISHNKNSALQKTQELVPTSLTEKGFSRDTIAKGRKLFYFYYNSPKFLSDFKFISGLEEPLFSLEHKFAGTCDCSYFTENSVIIRDYKSSSREKTEDEIETYFMQVAAYMVAYEEMYEMEVEKSQILICNDKTGLQIFELLRKDRDIYFNGFKVLLNKFHSSFNYEVLYERRDSTS